MAWQEQVQAELAQEQQPLQRVAAQVLGPQEQIAAVWVLRLQQRKYC
jgi:hypothetical protein